jgi:hypothetical protein
MDRRHFLTRAFQGLAVSATSLRASRAKADAADYRFLSACFGRGNNVAAAGGFETAMLDQQGRVIMHGALAMRAHEIALHPAKAMCLAVGRQPGRHSTMIDLATGRPLFDLALAADHEFNGHAVFLGDGAELVAIEEHVETSVGRLSFYDSATGQWRRAWSSHGIEPHEVLLDVTRHRLIVANGGILQRHAVGEVESSLVTIDLATGEVITKATLPEDLTSLSMRHIALTANGEVAFAMQDQDPQSDLRPLVGVMEETGRLRFLDIPRDIASTLRGYVGSIAIDTSSQVVCATSPKGGVAMFWALASGTWLGHVSIADGCGVAATADAGSFMLTGGKGDIFRVATIDPSGTVMSPHATIVARDPHWQWDNHLTLLPA